MNIINKNKWAYYNEYDSFMASWLRELIKAGLITDGEVDERSIDEVQPDDVKGFKRAHWFAGLGGWELAARLAGWPDDRPLWTGSPPCQPFSTAGKQKGKDDLRHLWPVFFNLIRECQPSVVFGEQVSSAIRHGWFDDLRTDMEKEGYATAMVVLPACSVNAPHKRDRLWYVAERLADTGSSRLERFNGAKSDGDQSRWLVEETDRFSASCSIYSRPKFNSTLAESHSSDRRPEQEYGQPEGGKCGESIGNGSRNGSGLGDTELHGLDESSLRRSISKGEREGGMLEHQRSNSTLGNANNNRCEQGSEAAKTSRQGSTYDAAGWVDSQLIYCRDGKYRPIPTEPALFPLVNGISNRVGILRGAGNAIVPQVAQKVIEAYMSLGEA